MKKNNKEVKKIPAKNYVIIIIVSILVVVITLYVRSFYLNYQANNMNTSIFESKSINQINIDDIDYAVNETTDGIIFVSYNGEGMISMMEKRLYKEIEKNNLNDKILYLNITENKELYLKTLKNKFPIFAANIKKAPMLMYIKNGECVEVIDSSSEMISFRTLNSLLSKYEIE